MQCSRDTIHTYPVTELVGGGGGGGGGVASLALPVYLPFAMFSFTQNKGGWVPLP